MTGPAVWRVDLIVGITDGDTLRVVRSRPVELDGRHYRLADDEPRGTALRLVWVDTPERGDPGWSAARADLTAWVQAAPRPLTVVCYTSAGWDRLLADLLDGDGGSASQWLMAGGNGGAGWPAYGATARGVGDR